MTAQNNNTRIQWVDLMKGFCMLAILFFHTDCYYAGESLIPYIVYVENALIAFFLLSGYLFYKEGQEFVLKRKLRSIVRGIVIPYFIFTTIMAVPKVWIHGGDISFPTLLYDILTGQASWFISALAVTEIIYSILLWITRGKLFLLSTLCIVAFLSMVAYGHLVENFHTKYTFYWHWENALLFLIFIHLGYVYHKYESYFHHIKTSLFLFLSLIWIMMKYMECEKGLFLTVEPVHVSSYALLLADGILTATLIMHICKKLPKWRCVCWTGKHSLVYYFICGGVPLTVSLVLEKMNFGYEGHYYRMIIAFAAVYIVSTAITWVIYRYLPFMAGKISAQR